MPNGESIKLTVKVLTFASVLGTVLSLLVGFLLFLEELDLTNERSTNVSALMTLLFLTLKQTSTLRYQLGI